MVGHPGKRPLKLPEADRVHHHEGDVLAVKKGVGVETGMQDEKEVGDKGYAPIFKEIVA